MERFDKYHNLLHMVGFTTELLDQLDRQTTKTVFNDYVKLRNNKAKVKKQVDNFLSGHSFKPQQKLEDVGKVQDGNFEGLTTIIAEKLEKDFFDTYKVDELNNIKNQNGTIQKKTVEQILSNMAAVNKVRPVKRKAETKADNTTTLSPSNESEKVKAMRERAQQQKR